MREHYIIKDGKRLRCGYTTGSCAAAAAKAAAYMLMTGRLPETVRIDTPAGIQLELEVREAILTSTYASCCIIKDAGDDPDVTDGQKIYAKVTKRGRGKITIDGGQGVGRITRKGFWGEVGEAAINPVPRRMISEEVAKISDCGFDVLIYVPEGEEIAKKTFNANLGIQGGISIIGTSGIVEPMSDEALKKTIYLEIDAALEEGIEEFVFFPGNYGEGLVNHLELSGAKVKISNFVGDALLYAVEKGIRHITLVGHIGKLCKLSIGAFNTHSKQCDARIEAFVYYLALQNAPLELLNRINGCISSEEAVKLIMGGKYEEVFTAMTRGCIDRVKRYVKVPELDIQVVMYSMDYGVLGGQDD
jgi:cobalt-precorrin-5B (C1)-methyltransferase